MKQTAFSSVNMLVLEDEDFAASFIGRVLDTLGVGKVITAVNGVAALDMLEHDRPDTDIFLCDLEMPEMGGYEFVRRIRYGAVPKYKDIPILVLTGGDTEKNVKKSRTHRINGFIVKPPKAVELEHHLRGALGLQK